MTTTGRKAVWDLARRQHGVVARGQLLELGYSPAAIRHRLERGRLHAVHRGVYAVGRRELTRQGEWTAAVLACGPGAVLSHHSAAAHWGMRTERGRIVHVSTPTFRRVTGLVVHRRSLAATGDAIEHEGIPVTTPALTLVDLAAAGMARDSLEAAVNEADIRGLTDPERLRADLAAMQGRPGAARLARVLDRRTFRLTRSKLERRFFAVCEHARLRRPQTRAIVNGFEVDFHFPALGLVVETDGLTYHRTPQEQAADRVRDQVHTAAGLTCLRFTHEQIAYEPDYVARTLAAVAKRLSAPATSPPAGRAAA